MEWNSPEHKQAVADLKRFRTGLEEHRPFPAYCVFCRAGIEVKQGRISGRTMAIHPKQQIFNPTKERFETCRRAGKIDWL